MRYVAEIGENYCMWPLDGGGEHRKCERLSQGSACKDAIHSQVSFSRAFCAHLYWKKTKGHTFSLAVNNRNSIIQPKGYTQLTIMFKLRSRTRSSLLWTLPSSLETSRGNPAFTLLPCSTQTLGEGNYGAKVTISFIELPTLVGNQSLAARSTCI